MATLREFPGQILGYTLFSVADIGGVMAVEG